MTVSYLHDTLRDLASAVIAIVNGGHEAAVPFLDEPGEHRLIIRREGEATVSLEVRWYDDWHDGGTGTSDYRVVLTCTAKLAHLRGQVLSALRGILEEHGEAGYKKKWAGHEFPIEQLRKLQAT